MQQLSDLNLFKKYFDEKKSNSEHDMIGEERQTRKSTTGSDSSQDSITDFLEKRLDEELEEFAKLILEKEFESPHFEDIILEAKKTEKDKLKIIPANLLETKSSFSTGSPNLDKLFGGGIPEKSLIEFYGEPGCGKTQILFQIAALGAEDGKVLFLDTEGTFSPTRIKMVAERFPNLEPDRILENILVFRITDFKQQLASIEQIVQIVEDGEDVKIIIIDSITNLFRAKLWGKDLLQLRQQLLNFHLYELKKVSEEYGLTILYSNQVSSIFVFVVSPEIIPVGGNIMGHNTGIRVHLRKGSRGYYEAELVSSSFLEPTKVRFSITPQGVL